MTRWGASGKKNPRLSFPLLRSVHSADGKTHRLPRCECSFFHECWLALKVLSQLKTGVSHSRPLSRRALYCVLVDLTDELSVTREESYGLGLPWWGASLTWLVILECPLGQQKIVLNTFGNFIRVCPVQCIGGVYWACLLSLLGRAATVQVSWRLHGLHLG